MWAAVTFGLVAATVALAILSTWHGLLDAPPLPAPTVGGA